MRDYTVLTNIYKYKSIQNLIKIESVTDKNNCWIFNRATNSHGYCLLKWDKKLMYAHRLSYLDFYGELDPNLTIDHLCKNKKCVNPTHLEQVTLIENVARNNSPPSVNKRRQFCINGHKFTKENTYVRKNRGNRECYACKKIKGKAYKLRIKNSPDVPSI